MEESDRGVFQRLANFASHASNFVYSTAKQVIARRRGAVDPRRFGAEESLKIRGNLDETETRNLLAAMGVSSSQ